VLLSPPENSAMHLFGSFNDSEEENDEDEDKKVGGEEEKESVTGESFLIKKAQEMKEELKKTYGNMDCSAEQLFLLHHGAMTAKLSIDYDLLGAFLAQAVYQLKEAVARGEIDVDGYDYEGAENHRPGYVGQLDESMSRIAQEAWATVRRITARRPAPPSTTKEQGSLLKAIKEKLKEMIAPDSEFGKVLKEKAGYMELDGNFQNIWAQVAGSCDTDALSVALISAIRLLITAFDQNERHLTLRAEMIV
jgi:hypothetical protein